MAEVLSGIVVVAINVWAEFCDGIEAWKLVGLGTVEQPLETTATIERKHKPFIV